MALSDTQACENVVREVNIADLITLINRAKTLTPEMVRDACKDLNNSEIADLVDKQAHLNEWLNLA